MGFLSLKNKKGFEIQFNWIFVLVAGAAILIFFSAIVVKQRNISETSTRATVLKSVDAIITGASVSMDTTKREDIPDSDIDVECNRISIGGVSKQYQNLILFSPGTITGNKFLWQTSSFGAPYRAINFLYATSSQLRYIIIGSSSVAYDINRSMSSDIKKEVYTSLPLVKDSNNYRVRFIVFDPGPMIVFPPALQSMPDKSVTALKVSGDIKKGSVDFYQKSGSSWLAKGSLPYIGKQALIGAIFSDTPEAYECSMKNAFQRLFFVTKVYYSKVGNLAALRPECNIQYSDALSDLNKILQSSQEFNQDNSNKIADASLDLDNLNNEAKKSSCPLIY